MAVLLKLARQDPPLILTTDQYVSHREKREVLFERLKDMGTNYTILFVGHSLEDADIRQILTEISSITKSRPRYYALILEFSDMHYRLWEGRKISLIKGTFEAFLNELAKDISEIERKFEPRQKDHEIERFFEKNDYKITSQSLAVLESHLQLVRSGMSSEKSRPELFYHGYSRDWSPIQEDLDISRTISDEIISQVILCEEDERNGTVEVYLITGSAGSGKSIAMKRIAWDSTIDYGKVCLFWSSEEKISYNSIIEIAEKINERIFLFIDKAVSHVPDILLLINKLSESKSKVTIIIAERNNEWNTECAAIHRFLNDKFEVRYLGIREINQLIDKLNRYNCLGVLKDKSREDQVKAFSETAGRQLLVALHEVTTAKSFAKIIEDEYDNIVPQKAQLIYRTVCIMNRLNVPVRAGIINRVHGVSFDQFNSSFFLPLENVVQITDFQPAYDRAYVARHQLIAEMVYTHALTSETDRYDNLISLLHALDIGYSPDRTAFREFIKYRSLSEIFSDLDLIENIYNVAYTICGDDDYYYQQKAIFYMRSVRKKYREAEELLYLAQKFGPYNTTIKHTLADLELIRASVTTGLERERHYNKANSLASTYTGSNSTSSHGYDTLVKVSLAKLENAIESEDEELITEAVKKAEKSLSDSLQKYPDDEILLNDEVKLARLLSDNVRAFETLKKAFSKNNSNSYIATSLSNIYIEKGLFEEAKKVLEQVIECRPSDKLAHAKIGMLLVRYFPEDLIGAEYHLKRSFTDGDTNHFNQLWYARQLYLNNSYGEYIELIGKLKSVRMKPESKHQVRGIVQDSQGDLKLIGKIVKKEHTYALIESTGYKGSHFLHESNCDSDKFSSLKEGSDICYKLGFTFAGAAALYL
ncbi:SIR2 family protein [Marinomonas sp. TI.3.20]|uniref:P-loop NTPase n=1 Tax=Marinomonas sp. TI.3.20 TaxID=3121296 RepID=UPI00311DDE25